MRGIQWIDGGKGKKGELFYLCKTAVAMEQIEIASSCQRPQKAVGGEITKKWEQIFSTNNFKFLNGQLLVWRPHAALP